MTRYCKNIYLRMQQQLSQCNNAHNCFEKYTECSFVTANKNWNLVKKKLKTYTFRSEELEIEFFKIFKPKFTSEIEYHSFVYHCILFQPADRLQAVEFLERERKRCEKFEAENSSFVQCYKNDRDELNRYYFLRKYYVYSSELETKMYDAGSDAVTNGDHLVAMILALKRYENFVNERLSIMIKCENEGLRTFTSRPD